MSVDLLFRALMNAERTALHLLIGDNIGGNAPPRTGTAPATAPAVAPGAVPGAAPGTFETTPAADVPPSSDPLLRPPIVPASHTLVGLPVPRPAVATGGADDPALAAQPLAVGQDADAAERTADGSSATRRAVAMPPAINDRAAMADSSPSRAERPDLTNAADRPTLSDRATVSDRPNVPDRLNAPDRTSPGQMSAAAPPALADAAETVLARSKADALPLNLDLSALTALAPADGQTERAGVIASFILNAAMIPGWPFPRPIELALGRAMVPDPLPVPHPAMNDAEAMTYLANMGAAEKLLARIRELLGRMTRLPRVLAALAVLLTTLGLVLSALREELEAMAEERRELEEHEEQGRRLLVG